MIKPVFIYMVDPKMAQQLFGRKIEPYDPVEPYWVVDEVHRHDYTYDTTAWMQDTNLPEGCSFQPSLDLVKDVYKFDNEQDALKKVAELYAEQLKTS